MISHGWLLEEPGPELVGAASTPVGQRWRSAALMGSLISCVEKELLTGYFCTLAHWPPRTDVLTDWPCMQRAAVRACSSSTSPDNHKVPSAEPSPFLLPSSSSSSFPSLTLLIVVLHHLDFLTAFLTPCLALRLPSQLSSRPSWSDCKPTAPPPPIFFCLFLSFSVTSLFPIAALRKLSCV